MYFLRTPRLARWIFPDLLWNMPEHENKIYLTFDDGPDPESTPWLLDILNKNQAGATFFFKGTQAEKFPELVKQVAAAGHSIGSHSFSHPDAFKSVHSDYLEDVRRGRNTVSEILQQPVDLFRPPYGRLTRKLYRQLRNDHRIVMWSLMPGDFDPKVTPENLLENCLRHSSPGSIIVLHENEKSRQKLKSFLPELLEKFREKGFSLDKL